MARVLLVDDDAAGLDLRKLILEREGHQISTASDPARARALFAELPPRLTSSWTCGFPNPPTACP